MPETETFARMDPRELVTDRNIRTHPGLDDDFVATIAEFGVLEPIVAVRCGAGQVRVRMGERRTLGAIKAGRADVPVLIIGDERDDTAAEIERRLAQFVENEHRSGLTVADKARFVQEMLDLGVSEDGDPQARTGSPRRPDRRRGRGQVEARHRSSRQVRLPDTDPGRGNRRVRGRPRCRQGPGGRSQARRGQLQPHTPASAR